MHHFFIIVFLLLSSIISSTIKAENGLTTTNFSSAVKAEIITDRDTILLNSKIHENPPKLGILFNIDPGWHIYGQDPGDAGQPTRISFSVEELNIGNSKWKTSTPVWPETETFKEKGDITTFGYTNKVLAVSSLSPPPIIETNESEIIIKAEVSWLACLDRCVPGKATLEKIIKVSSRAAEEAPKNLELFKTFARSDLAKNDASKIDVLKIDPAKNTDQPLWFFLLSAFIGGMILNLMPCVLPVLSLKLFSLVNMTGCDKNKRYKDLFWFTFGIILSFNILALFVFSLKKIGEPVGWGFQFQNINFVYFVTILIFVLSLKFFNVKLPGFKVHQSCADYLEKQKLSDNRIQNLIDGVLVTLLSTPCTAPILGAAVGFALSQSPVKSFIIFNTIGLGLATPYILLSSSKKALSILPKPGPWMESFREILGLAMLGTVIWLISIQESIVDKSSINSLTILFIVFCLIKVFEVSKSIFSKIILIIVCGIATISFIPTTEKESVNWLPYSEQLIQETKGPIFLDFTASWCITCKYNEKFILSTDEILEEFKKHNITLVKADWSDGSSEISKALSSYSGNGVPHYVLIDESKGIKEVLPTVLTNGIIKDYLNRLNK